MDEPLKNRLTEDSTLSHFEPMSERYKITFAEIGGLEKLKREANLKIIQPFKNPELFKRFKKQAGGGILLYGPPGCGKSYFARAIAGECGATFFNVGIDQILDMYVGNSEKTSNTSSKAHAMLSPPFSLWTRSMRLDAAEICSATPT